VIGVDCLRVCDGLLLRQRRCFILFDVSVSRATAWLFLCRCYKHSFYGIQSFQCMEATPSLACANKCVFCWRHHKNPVGREWRWSVDAPEMIVEQAIEKHRAMVHELRGMPGVKQERWEEAHTVRHCALSLVGEPIMYPHVNTLIRLLHERNISSFMVRPAAHALSLRWCRAACMSQGSVAVTSIAPPVCLPPCR